MQTKVGELAWSAGLVPEMEPFGQSASERGNATGGTAWSWRNRKAPGLNTSMPFG